MKVDSMFVDFVGKVGNRGTKFHGDWLINLRDPVTKLKKKTSAVKDKSAMKTIIYGWTN